MHPGQHLAGPRCGPPPQGRRRAGSGPRPAPPIRLAIITAFVVCQDGTLQPWGVSCHHERQHRRLGRGTDQGRPYPAQARRLAAPVLEPADRAQPGHVADEVRQHRGGTYAERPGTQWTVGNGRRRLVHESEASHDWNPGGATSCPGSGSWPGSGPGQSRGCDPRSEAAAAAPKSVEIHELRTQALLHSPQRPSRLGLVHRRPRDAIGGLQDERDPDRVHLQPRLLTHLPAGARPERLTRARCPARQHIVRVGPPASPNQRGTCPSGPNTSAEQRTIVASAMTSPSTPKNIGGQIEAISGQLPRWCQRASSPSSTV